MTTATCRVTFGTPDGSDGPFYVIELDDTMNLDANGEAKTTFAPGETIWFLLHVEPGYAPDRIYQTDGQVSAAGQVVLPRLQEGVVWTPEDLAMETTYYPLGEVIPDWQGNQISLQPIEGRTLTATADPLTLMARADLSYVVEFFRFRFDPPSNMELAPGDAYLIDAMITLVAV